jgi:uncharacterized protein (DUF4415 family)
MSLKKQTFILTSKNKCSGNSFLFLRFVTSKRDRANLDRRKKRKKKGAIQQQPNKRKHISVVRLNNAVVDMLQGTGARNQTQRGMVSFQIQLTSLFIYYTYIYFSVFFFRKTSEMLCVCS